MNAATSHQLAKSVFVAFTALAMTVTLHAEIRSKSQGLIVVQPRDLPEVAQMPGNSLFLHSEDLVKPIFTSSSSRVRASQSLMLQIQARSSWLSRSR